MSRRTSRPAGPLGRLAKGNEVRDLTPQGIKAALDAMPDGADAAETKSTSDFYATSTIYNDDIKTPPAR